MSSSGGSVDTAAEASARKGERFNALLWAGTLAPLLAAFWVVARRYDMSTRIGGHMASGFASFALLLAAYWAFGFGAAEALRRVLTSRAARVLAPGVLVIAYLVFSIPRGEFRWYYAVIFFVIPVGLAAMYECVPPTPPAWPNPGQTGAPKTHSGQIRADVGHEPAVVEFSAPTPPAWPNPGQTGAPKTHIGQNRADVGHEPAMVEFSAPTPPAWPTPGQTGAPARNRGLTWQDVVALVVVGAPVEFRLLAGAWPHRGLSALPKFLLVDSALYAFLVVRGMEAVGFDFRVRLRDVAIGLREWAFYAPIAIGLGLALGFIRWNPWKPNAAVIAASYLITFFFVAIPEEFFFRGLLQNLLEPRLGRGRALAVAAVIFGLSHFNKPLPFNWRYVIMASIAGVFYGRAWLDRQRLTCSAITHTTVDVVWGLWWK